MPQSNVCDSGVIKDMPSVVRHQDKGHVMLPIVADHAVMVMYMPAWLQLFMRVCDVPALNPVFTECIMI